MLCCIFLVPRIINQRCKKRGAPFFRKSLLLFSLRCQQLSSTRWLTRCSTEISSIRERELSLTSWNGVERKGKHRERERNGLESSSFHLVFVQINRGDLITTPTPTNNNRILLPFGNLFQFSGMRSSRAQLMIKTNSPSFVA